MPERTLLQSEGAALDSVLAEIEKERSVIEVSGWETGFANLSRALDGMRPGLHLLIGRPAIGKTSFARQLLDQVAMHNQVPESFTSLKPRKSCVSRLCTLEQPGHAETAAAAPICSTGTASRRHNIARRSVAAELG
jgi:replicative DNA helicase